MIERYEYRGHPVVVTDKLPFGHPDGTWVISGSERGWHVLYTGEFSAVQIRGGLESLASIADAKLEVQRLVDEEMLQWERRDSQDAQRAQALANAAGGDAIDARPYEICGGNVHVAVEAPIALLMAAHNALAHDDPLRDQIRTHLQSQSKRRSAVAGLWIDADGRLAFDENRAIAEAHRRRRQRYADALRKKMKRVMADYASVLGHDAEERRYGTVTTTNALVPLTELTPMVSTLTSVDMPLLAPLTTLAKSTREGEGL